jgi:hypothetical protein
MTSGFNLIACSASFKATVWQELAAFIDIPVFVCCLVLGKFGLCLKLISEIEGLEWLVCFEILEPPSPMTRDGGSKISKQTNHSKPSISLISFRHKPNFPNTNEFSVAPESNNDSTSALLDAVCMYALMVIDFLSNKYTWSSVPLLIQAAQIRAFKNLTPLFLQLVLHSFGVTVPYLWGTRPILWPGAPLWGCWIVLAPSVGVECHKPILLVLVLVGLLVSICS